MVPAVGIAFTQSTFTVAFTSLSIGLAYTAVLLIVAWFALKRSQIME
jgi:hypothetical protein